MDGGEEYLYCVTVAVIINYIAKYTTGMAFNHKNIIFSSMSSESAEHISNFYYQCAIIDYQFQLVYLLSEGQLIHVEIFTLLIYSIYFEYNTHTVHHVTLINHSITATN